ncbi:MAG: hypothetical protein LBJ24_03205 [Treponema sp.]|jgi:hypothetical protein|nr:hypothetical protein [Treponema sp.]
MSKSTDWLPGSREGILLMARNWQDVAGTNAPAWGIPNGVITEFSAVITAADIALAAAKNETTRTPAKRQSLLAWSLAA